MMPQWTQTKDNRKKFQPSGPVSYTQHPPSITIQSSGSMEPRSESKDWPATAAIPRHGRLPFGSGERQPRVLACVLCMVVESESQRGATSAHEGLHEGVETRKRQANGSATSLPQTDHGNGPSLEQPFHCWVLQPLQRLSQQLERDVLTVYVDRAVYRVARMSY